MHKLIINVTLLCVLCGIGCAAFVSCQNGVTPKPSTRPPPPPAKKFSDKTETCVTYHRVESRTAVPGGYTAVKQTMRVVVSVSGGGNRSIDYETKPLTYVADIIEKPPRYLVTVTDTDGKNPRVLDGHSYFVAAGEVGTFLKITEAVVMRHFESGPPTEESRRIISVERSDRLPDANAPLETAK